MGCVTGLLDSDVRVSSAVPELRCDIDRLGCNDRFSTIFFWIDFFILFGC